MSFIKNKRKIIIWLFCIALFLIIAFPYLKSEYLTQRYGNEFKELYLQTGMIEEIEYFRVLKKNNESADVNYITKDHSSSVLITFKLENQNWILNEWRTIWSKSGSADDFIWPYYP